MQHQAESVLALFNLGNALQQRGSLEEAAACYRQAIALDPDYALAHNNLAVALMAQGRLDEAVASFAQALLLAPDYAEAHNNLGVALKRQKRLDEAIACYHRALAINPGYAKAMLNLGSAYLLKKDYAPALQWSQASLAIDPDQVEANQNIAAIMLEAGRLDEAQQYRDRAYRKQAIFIDLAPNRKRTVLLLWAAAKGNVPIEFLFPAQTNTLITWMMEYATEDQARSLPNYDLVFNAIGDSDVAGPTTATVARFLLDCRKPVLNHPAAVARTARNQIPALFAPIADTLVPLTLRLDPKDFKKRLLTLPGVRLPVLVRPSGSHGGDHLIKLESEQELTDLVAWNADCYYATNYHDYRSDDGYFRKYRMVFIDRQAYPYHLAIGERWLLHYETAGMLGEAWKRAEEAMFLEDPGGAIGPQAMAAVEAIGRKLDLDYCGLDFSVLPDGRVLVFEANATMLVHPEAGQDVLHFKNPYIQRIFDAFDALLTRRISAA
ncbi:photosystem I assembly protein Ycf3 [mine drainage metagenome]|uniref:Photosystem I assembly protein Ycf3 n=1 Tax=mine drainage metagenome TaxID=410659 RepID=A0A1J5RYY7_9ZZZZ